MNAMKNMIDAMAFDNLKHLATRKQSLLAILNYHKTFDEEHQAMEYLGLIGNVGLTLEY
jgi:hypothetical protein